MCASLTSEPHVTHQLHNLRRCKCGVDLAGDDVHVGAAKEVESSECRRPNKVVFNEVALGVSSFGCNLNVKGSSFGAYRER